MPPNGSAELQTVLITGGAGYVGSQSVLHFQSLGWRVVVFDNLSTGHADFGALADEFVTGDLLDRQAVTAVFDRWNFSGILHCASKCLVGESVANPMLYLRQNVGGAANLVEAAQQHSNVPIVFSSSAAVYGYARHLPISEDHERSPINPYGFSKLVVEEALLVAHEATGLRSVALRYFNAAGADPAGRVGERHDPETHLIPNIIQSAVLGQRRPFEIYGNDYDTRDGTCLRDYIHTQDLARAHAMAMEYLWAGGECVALNVGSGTGQTIREVVQAVETHLEREIPVTVAPRRPGDPASLLANGDKAAEILDFRPEFSGIDEIVATAVRWHTDEGNRNVL